MDIHFVKENNKEIFTDFEERMGIDYAIENNVGD